MLRNKLFNFSYSVSFNFLLNVKTRTRTHTYKEEGGPHLSCIPPLKLVMAPLTPTNHDLA